VNGFLPALSLAPVHWFSIRTIVLANALITVHVVLAKAESKTAANVNALPLSHRMDALEVFKNGTMIPANANAQLERQCQLAVVVMVRSGMKLCAVADAQHQNQFALELLNTTN